MLQGVQTTPLSFLATFVVISFEVSTFKRVPLLARCTAKIGPFCKYKDIVQEYHSPPRDKISTSIRYGGAYVLTSVLCTTTLHFTGV